MRTGPTPIRARAVSTGTPSLPRDHLAHCAAALRSLPRMRRSPALGWAFKSEPALHSPSCSERREKPAASKLGDRFWFLDSAASSANSGRATHPAMQQQPNAWGMYDISGNVRGAPTRLAAQSGKRVNRARVRLRIRGKREPGFGLGARVRTRGEMPASSGRVGYAGEPLRHWARQANSACSVQTRPTPVGSSAERARNRSRDRNRHQARPPARVQTVSGSIAKASQAHVSQEPAHRREQNPSKRRGPADSFPRKGQGNHQVLTTRHYEERASPDFAQTVSTTNASHTSLPRMSEHCERTKIG